MEKFNTLNIQGAVPIFNIEANYSGGRNNPKPKIGQPRTPAPEPETEPSKEEDPSKKKRKKSAYEIIC